MKKFAFISRHQPTAEQITLAAEQNVELVPVGDCDAFTITPEWLEEQNPGPDKYFYGAVVVHPAAALNLRFEYDIGVFENGNRAGEGEKPTFYAKAFHIFQ